VLVMKVCMGKNKRVSRDSVDPSGERVPVSVPVQQRLRCDSPGSTKTSWRSGCSEAGHCFGAEANVGHRKGLNHGHGMPAMRPAAAWLEEDRGDLVPQMCRWQRGTVDGQRRGLACPRMLTRGTEQRAREGVSASSKPPCKAAAEPQRWPASPPHQRGDPLWVVWGEHREGTPKSRFGKESHMSSHSGRKTILKCAPSTQGYL